MITGEIHRTRGLLGMFWIASIQQNGKILEAGTNRVFDNVSEHPTEEDARAWCRTRLAHLDVPDAAIVDITSPQFKGGVS